MEQDTKKVILDGQEVPQEKLEEAKANKAVKIAEKKDGTYVTLQKLHGKDD